MNQELTEPRIKIGEYELRDWILEHGWKITVPNFILSIAIFLSTSGMEFRDIVLHYHMTNNGYHEYVYAITTIDSLLIMWFLLSITVGLPLVIATVIPKIISTQHSSKSVEVETQ